MNAPIPAVAPRRTTLRRAPSRYLRNSRRERPPRAAFDYQTAHEKPDRLLGRYRDQSGHPREVVALGGAARSVLVVDRDAATLTDRRLVAHLPSDEPAKNADIVCNEYLADKGRARCRAVTATDLEVAPFDDIVPQDRAQPPVIRASSGTYSLEPVDGTKSIPELRWLAQVGSTQPRVVSLREVVARLESYEPARALTRVSLARHRHDPQLSVCTLRAELERVDSSRIVLNRGLRAAVLEAIRAQGLTASEIAIRCGRVKRDARGNVTGETSWLARRVGLVPESRGSLPTPWVHSEVLGLIARCGLGVSPREVELG
jgi:hypothetical protein